MKNSWTTSDVINATRGDLLSGPPARYFSGISIDSRNISTGEIFIAIKGQTHDGHGFVGDVIGAGVKGVIVDKDKIVRIPTDQLKRADVTCVAVADTTRALGDLAAFHRNRNKVSVIAITGSNGKTTTKDMTAAVVSQGFHILATRGNFNNEIGVPLTLFRLEASHQWAVLEMGTNSPGEIRRLSEICQPDIGVLTNIGPAHLKGLESLEGVMHAKAELLEKIKAGGTAVLNADDERVMKIAKGALPKIFFFGQSERAAVRANSIVEKKLGVTFDLILPADTVSVNLPIHGTFMVSNALAAAAVGHLIGLSAQDIRAGLEAFRPNPGRMNVLETKKGITIVDDSYNANPDSMAAALTTLRNLKGSQRGFFVAGDMFELGLQAESLHREIGSKAVLAGISMLYVTGDHAEAVASGAKESNMSRRNIFVGTKEEIVEDLKDQLRSKDWILVKGSRAMGMEKIVHQLRVWADS